MSGPTRYGPSTPIPGSSGMTARQVRAFGHPRYNDPDSVSAEQAEREDMKAEMEDMNDENRERGPASLREMVRDVVTKGPSTIKRMYYGRGKKKKTRRTNKKRKTRRHKKTARRSRRL